MDISTIKNLRAMYCAHTRNHNYQCKCKAINALQPKLGIDQASTCCVNPGMIYSKLKYGNSYASHFHTFPDFSRKSVFKNILQIVKLAPIALKILDTVDDTRQIFFLFILTYSQRNYVYSLSLYRRAKV